MALIAVEYDRVYD